MGGSLFVAGALFSVTLPAQAAAGGAEQAGTPAKMNLTPAPVRDSYEGPPLLLGRGKRIKVGGYAGLGAAYTRFMGRDSGLMSLEGAFLFDHRLSLGVAGYGGLAMRYSVFGNLPVYGTFGVLLGGGVVNLHRDYGWDDESDWDDDWDADRDDAWEHGRFDTFLVVQPEVTLHGNITRWLRLGATLGYRFTGGVGRFGLGESDLNGIVAGGNIQLGWF
jgi:hypothetical protein